MDNDYDSLGRLDTKRNYAHGVRIPGVPGMFDYTLDNADRRTAVTRGDGSRIDYGYDAIGQLTSAVRKFASGDVDHSYRYQYGYDPSGNPTNRVENGQARTYTSNELNQLTTGTVPTHTDVAGRVEGDTASVTVNGQPATLQPTPKAFYKDQLPLAAGTNQFEAILADTLGRTATNRSTVVKDAAPVFSYDDNGNMLSDGTWDYTWDDENRLLTAEPVHPKPGDKKVQNYYDPRSRRAAKHVYVRNAAGDWAAEKEIRFTWLDWLMVREDIQAGALTDTKRYNWGVDLSGTLKGAGAVGSLLHAEGLHNQAVFALHPTYDANGNVVAHVHAGGEVTEFGYDPFGRILNQSTVNSSPSAILFSTKYMDDETGMNYFGSRFYSLNLCRWMNRDKISELGGLNVYQYAYSDPINHHDFSGYIPVSSISTTIDLPLSPSDNPIDFHRHYLNGNGETIDLNARGASGMLRQVIEKSSDSLNRIREKFLNEGEASAACGESKEYSGIIPPTDAHVNILYQHRGGRSKPGQLIDIFIRYANGDPYSTIFNQFRVEGKYSCRAISYCECCDWAKQDFKIKSIFVSCKFEMNLTDRYANPGDEGPRLDYDEILERPKKDACNDDCVKKFEIDIALKRAEAYNNLIRCRESCEEKFPRTMDSWLGTPYWIKGAWTENSHKWIEKEGCGATK